MEKNFEKADIKLGRTFILGPWVQIDVADNVFCEGRTFELELLTKSEWDLNSKLFDLHLLVKEPINWIEKGIFVTITGIPGLERLYAEAQALGIKLYSNDTKAVPGSIRALPHIIPNKNIVFQFARSGWSSVWLSMLVGTPLVMPDFDPKDDPEIYFNNLAVEKLGIGLIYHGESLMELFQKAKKVREKQAQVQAGILAKWGTLDGTAYCAKLFVDDFLKK